MTLTQRYPFLRNKMIVALSAAGTLVGLGALLKDYMQGGRYTKNNRIDGKVVVITGANTGIGKETARVLAGRGAIVYMACRDMVKCEDTRKEIVLQTKNQLVYSRECDLASFESIRNFAKTFKSEQNRLDILINNAGVMRCPKSLTKDGIETQIGVNHMGHFLLTNLLLDLLKTAAPSRIVTVSSLAHRYGTINMDDLNSKNKYDPNHAYSQSKLANVLFTKELAKRLHGTGVTATALHPGVVDTELMRHMGVFQNVLTAFVTKMVLWPFMKTPLSGAQTTIYAAIDPDLETVTDVYFSDCKPKEVAEAGQNVEMAQWLWTVSEKWTRLDPEQRSK